MKWLVYVAALWCCLKLCGGAGLALVKSANAKTVPVSSKSAEADTPDDAECLPGSEWESHCHQCKCTESGLAQCDPIRGCVSKIPEPIRCKPNTTFGRDCNSCVCLHNGLGLCTLEPCHRSVKKKSDLPSGHDCAPHTFWKSRCNDCGCSPNGYAYCTEKPCTGSAEPILTCAPDSMWKNECNTCFCTPNGYPLCTRMGCTLNVNFEPARSVNTQAGGGNIESDSDLEIDHDRKTTKIFSTFYSDDENNAEDTNDEGSDNEMPRHKVIKTKPTAFHGKTSHFSEQEYSRQPKNTSYGYTNMKSHRAKQNQFKKAVSNSYSRANKVVIMDDYTESPGGYELRARATKFGYEKPHSTRKNAKKPPQLVAEADPNKFVDELFNYMMQETKPTERVGNMRKEPEIISFDDKGDLSDSDDESVGSKQKYKRSLLCKPNEVFQDDCNSCTCSEQGDSYSCTHNECMNRDMNKEVEVFMESEGVDHIERHSVCKPSGTFYIGCNTCHCNHDGTDYNCTNKPCPLPDDVELFHELRDEKSQNRTVCVANRMFTMDCNTCWCNEDGTSYFCTRRVCVPGEIEEESEKPEEFRLIMKQCRPDEVFELDCNTCRCNSDGKSFSCTRRACEEEPSEELRKNGTLSRRIREKESPKACQPGQEFRLDCNKCLCDNKGQDFSCTRIDCTALNNNGGLAPYGAGGPRVKRGAAREVPVECVPGSVFDQQCNVCRCTSDGKHAMCTLNDCAKPKEDAADADSESSFRCNPGEQFKRGCNDCTCSADGKSIFCTLRLCDQDITAGM